MAHKTKIDALIQSLHEVASESEEARGDTLDALRDLRRSLATRNEIYNRFEQMNNELTISHVAQDLNIYQILAESKKPIDVAKLSAKVGAAPLLTRSSTPSPATETTPNVNRSYPAVSSLCRPDKGDRAGYIFGQRGNKGSR